MRRDTTRYFFALYGDARTSVAMRLRTILLFPGLLAILIYRVCHHLLYGAEPNIATKLSYGALWLASRWYAIAVGIEIDSHAHIGPGLFINHFGAIIVGPAYIGENCNIAQSVTIGKSSMVTDWELETVDVLDVPTIGDRVWIGPGAVIAGPVSVGNDASVSANTLVIRDVQPRGVAMGVPAQIVSVKGSFRQVRYRGMEDDAERTAAILETRRASL
ncbi:serine O-acetyltransferase [Trebonia kvetii]|nr:DapH/DapD/GlmU-related protein [Trebonia kvetii]